MYYVIGPDTSDACTAAYRAGKLLVWASDPYLAILDTDRYRSRSFALEVAGRCKK